MVNVDKKTVVASDDEVENILLLYKDNPEQLFGLYYNPDNFLNFNKAFDDKNNLVRFGQCKFKQEVSYNKEGEKCIDFTYKFDGDVHLANNHRTIRMFYVSRFLGKRPYSLISSQGYMELLNNSYGREKPYMENSEYFNIFNNGSNEYDVEEIKNNKVKTYKFDSRFLTLNYYTAQEAYVLRCDKNIGDLISTIDFDGLKRSKTRHKYIAHYMKGNNKFHTFSVPKWFDKELDDLQKIWGKEASFTFCEDGTVSEFSIGPIYAFCEKKLNKTNNIIKIY